MTDATLEQRLAALESRLERLETMLASVGERLDRTTGGLADTKAAIEAWVTDYVSLRLQQLVPETCEGPFEEFSGNGIVVGDQDTHRAAPRLRRRR